MPPQNIFTREMFIEAAFKVVRSKGIEKLSARSLAHELHCSTMPIYSYLKSMEQLRLELEKKAVDLLLDYQHTRRTDSPFFDMGLGYIMFARNEKHLFRFIFPGGGRVTGRSRRGGMMRQMAFDDLLSDMHKDPLLSGIDTQKMENILLKMWIFNHGLAFLANNNLLPDNSEKAIEDLLYDTGRTIVMDALNPAESDMEVHHESTGTEFKPAGEGTKQDGADADVSRQRHAGRRRRGRDD